MQAEREKKEGVHWVDVSDRTAIVDQCLVGETNLRLEPTRKQDKNKYSAGVRWAKDKELKRPRQDSNLLDYFEENKLTKTEKI